MTRLKKTLYKHDKPEKLHKGSRGHDHPDALGFLRCPPKLALYASELIAMFAVGLGLFFRPCQRALRISAPYYPCFLRDSHVLALPEVVFLRPCTP